MSLITPSRHDGRSANQLRPVVFLPNFTTIPTASVLGKFGQTHLFCTVNIEEGVPKFLQGKNQGWLTAEYRMLPGSTFPRQPRELMKLSGRTQEIQRLIGRSLRAALDLEKLPNYTVTVDVDVLQADGGTRTGAITTGFVALEAAINRLLSDGKLMESPIRHRVAAVSVGLVNGSPLLDLDYSEDSQAEVDFNVVMDDLGNLIEVQGTGESGTFTRQQLNEMLDLATVGIKQLQQFQAEQAIGCP
ncbi:MAG: ribonuclease PH [Pseudanabaena sp. ELA607]